MTNGGITAPVATLLASMAVSMASIASDLVSGCACRIFGLASERMPGV